MLWVISIFSSTCFSQSSRHCRCNRCGLHADTSRRYAFKRLKCWEMSLLVPFFTNKFLLHLWSYTFCFHVFKNLAIFESGWLIFENENLKLLGNFMLRITFSFPFKKGQHLFLGYRSDNFFVTSLFRKLITTINKILTKTENVVAEIT